MVNCRCNSALLPRERVGGGEREKERKTEKVLNRDKKRDRVKRVEGRGGRDTDEVRGRGNM